MPSLKSRQGVHLEPTDGHCYTKIHNDWDTSLCQIHHNHWKRESIHPSIHPSIMKTPGPNLQAVSSPPLLVSCYHSSHPSTHEQTLSSARVPDETGSPQSLSDI
ncbi:hypothetical protein AMECASPLE_033066 [Ameca splendens]|uniref:Uncharacterized protein n=1 Tax=Ameca splendens TaxID=208324 RepID=A0ABV1AE87_9TELE